MTAADKIAEARALIEPLAGHTPGPWEVGIDDGGNPLSGRPGVFAPAELDCGIVHWDGFVQEYWRSARGDNEIHANARLIAAAPDLRDTVAALADLAEAQAQEIAKLHEALTASGATKAAYIGEFRQSVRCIDEDGDEVWGDVLIEWTVIEEIMAAIRARAALGDTQ